MLKNQRPIIVHIDVDAFFVQVECNRDTSLFSYKYIAVQQHDDIIAVSHQARTDYGVKKHDKPSEALQKCSQLKLVQVPKWEGTSKVTYKYYREASYEIFHKNLLQFINEYINNILMLNEMKFVNNKLYKMEKVSIDEVYLDVTNLMEEISEYLFLKDCDELQEYLIKIIENNSTKELETIVNDSGNTVDWKSIIIKSLSDEDIEYCKYIVKQFITSDLVLFIRKEMKKTLNYQLSAGISTNKFLSKLACSKYKPYKQCILFNENAIDNLLKTIPLEKCNKISLVIGKNIFEEFVNHFKEKVKNVIDLRKVSDSEMKKFFIEIFKDNKSNKERDNINKYVTFIRNLSKGIDLDKVENNPPPKQFSCSMSLTPIHIKHLHTSIRKVIRFVAMELVERLHDDELMFEKIENGEKIKRFATNFSFRYRFVDCKEESKTLQMSQVSKSKNKPSLDDFVEACVGILRQSNSLSDVMGKSVNEEISCEKDKDLLSQSKHELRWIQMSCTNFKYQKSNEKKKAATLNNETSVKQPVINIIKEDKETKISTSSLVDFEKVKCPICNKSCFPSLIEVHVNSHFKEENNTNSRKTATSSPQKRKKNKNTSSITLDNYFTKKLKK